MKLNIILRTPTSLSSEYYSPALIQHNMHVVIYFNDKPLFLADTLDREIEPYAHHDDAVLIDELNSSAVNSMIHEMKLSKIHAGIFIHHNLEELKKSFFRKFTLIRAAGGIVTNEKGQLLFMMRLGKWDLPKGKLDEGESLEDCAVRETEEETGLKNVKLTGPITITYHTYDESGKHILKESHWFNLKVKGKQELIPQTEEQITELRWFDKADLRVVIDNTYPNILQVLDEGGHLSF